MEINLSGIDPKVVTPRFNEGGVTTEGRFISMVYNKDEAKGYEAVDFTISKDGAERTIKEFVPKPENARPRDIYEGGKVVGKETQEQAINREKNDFVMKIYAVALLFTDDVTAKRILGSPSSYEQLVNDINTKIIGKSSKDFPVNFFLVFRNKEAGAKPANSNLEIPTGLNGSNGSNCWIEKSEYSQTDSALLPPKVRPNKKQLSNNPIAYYSVHEKYPFIANNTDTSAPIMGGSPSETVDDDLPF